ncbi:hypothetical protein H5410_036723 [Solanum commersonii]|uniref:Uncharacterized protein n=1 Tax=Solanum commersonii TaxID=4109 RepID=A0A9J5Y4B8_SOLCO|nr:hypothetical protein H5410_036723 [Solanum commersonii]
MDHRLWMYNMHYEIGVGLKHESIDDTVIVHMYHNGFKPRYFVWIDHGERNGMNDMRNRTNRNDEADIDPLFPPILIFNQNDRGSKKHGKRGFTNMEMQSAVTHIFLNFPEIQPYLK